MPTIKNIIIFIAIGTVFVLIYIFFIKPSPPVDNLISSSSNLSEQSAETLARNASATQDFLGLLLSVQNIKLDDTIFSDEAFIGLRDSSIVLIPDGNEGRPNPFAPLGTDVVAPPVGTASGNAETTETSILP